jgi:hypothetical protein
MCLKLVEDFPNEDTDHEIFVQVAELLSLAVIQNEPISNYLLQ